MFGRCFAGEIKKLARPRGLIILGVLLVIFFILYAVIYNIDLDAMLNSLNDMMAEYGETGLIIDKDEYFDEDGNPVTEEEYAEKYGYINMDYIGLANPSNIDAILAELNAYRESFDAADNAVYDRQSSYLKGAIVMLEYMKENGIYGKDVAVEGYGDYLRMNTADSFAYSYFTLVLGILTIYGIVLAAGLYADEYRRGTIKLVMLRPVSRNAMTTAKLAAVFAYLVGILGAASLIAYLYGLISFDSVSGREVFVVFNNSSVFRTTAGGAIFLKMFLHVVFLLSNVSLSFMLGSVTRKKTLAIVLAFVVYLGIIASIGSALGLERFMFSTNTDLTTYFGLSYNIPVGGSFFIALPVLAGYLAIIMTALYVTVNKRDVI